MIDGVLTAWLITSALAAVYVAYDAFAVGNPELTVMRWGWVLVTLYIGPVGACLYILSCKPPASQIHREFTAPLWKQSLGSTMHCLAGDATGFIVAASITVFLGLPVWLDAISEYLFGFVFGLLIFQAVFMRGMLGGSYRRAIRRSFMPELLSMNMVMAGMIPVMVLIMTNYPSAMQAGSVRFLGTLSLATFVGLATAYPMNVWLVATHQKHGMGTVVADDPRGSRLAGNWLRLRLAIARHEQPEAHPVLAASPSSSVPGAMPMNSEHLPADSMFTGEDHRGLAAMAASASVTHVQLAAVTILSLLALGAGVFLATLFGNLAG